MDGHVKPITAVFDGKNRELVIPVYQRNYDWQVKHCSQFFDDLEQMIIEGKPKHFFGSIVGKTEGSFRWIIIDGQQRLTTTSLLILALAHSLRAEEVASDDPELARKIVEDYLCVGDGREEKFKLKPVKNDAAAYNRLFRGENEFMEESNVTHNYRYFRDRLNHTSLTGDQVWRAIEQLEIMHLDLELHDDPQRIFESLNSTGLDLSEADKIRNFILMGLTKDRQDDIYETRWNPIEEFSDFQTDRFIRWYLTSKSGKTPREADVYESFKAYAENLDSGIEQLIDDMFHYANYFCQLRNANTRFPAVNQRLKRAQRVLGEVVLPFLMPVLRDAEKGSISAEDLDSVVAIVESFFFRRFASSIPTNALNKIFASSYSELMKLKTGDQTYSEVIAYILRRRGGSGRFPTDEEFSDGFSTRDFYSVRSEHKQYIFDRLENGDSGDTLDIAHKLQSNEITIEHIMPQNLSEWWKDSLGENYEEIHKTWVNRIGNLTVTGYNSAYSNAPFPKKKEMLNGFDETPYRLNRYIQKCDSWGSVELEERTKLLADKALRMWQLPDTSFRPPEAVLDVVPMGDDTDFQNRRIVRFSFRDVDKAVATWSEMLPEVIKIIAESHRSEILNFATGERSLSIDSKRIENLAEGWRAIDAGLAVEVRTSTRTKVDLLRRLFDHLEIDTDELTLTLRPLATIHESEDEVENEPYSSLTKFLPLLDEAQALDSNSENMTNLHHQLVEELTSIEIHDDTGELFAPSRLVNEDTQIDSLSDIECKKALLEVGNKAKVLLSIDTKFASEYLHERIKNGNLMNWIRRLETLSR